eukprot:SAG31_NODE_27344_length_427_cov_1.103659_2_plen_74_part_01
MSTSIVCGNFVISSYEWRGSEDKRKGVYVDGLSEWVVRTPAEIYGLLARGSEQRATAATGMNEVLQCMRIHLPQ